MYTGQDWSEAGWSKTTTKKELNSNVSKNKALRTGEAAAERKEFGKSNAKNDIGARAAALDRDTGEEGFHHKTVSADMKQLIQQARMAKGMTQKDLATRINEKPQVIGQYEQGTAIPNGAIIQKLQKALGVTLKSKPKAKAQGKAAPRR